MKKWPTWSLVVCVQLAVLLATAVSFGHAKQRTSHDITSPDLRQHAWIPTPLYNAPDLVADDQLRAVLISLRPRFATGERNVNFVEHALRVWGADSTFDDPECMSGADMLSFLTDHHKFVEAYGADAPPLLVDTPEKLDIRWTGKGAEFGKAASRHHDHWLACLIEAGVDLDWAVRTPRQARPLREWIARAVEDFRLDDREYEWTSMVFAYTLNPQNHWANDQSRQFTFDLVAKRLLRADNSLGVCNGTHRLYALAVLARLQQETPVLSPQTHGQVCQRLRQVSELLVAAQEDGGGWNRRWTEGARALDGKDTTPLVDKVLVTGHHLEWLSIAPADVLPTHQTLVRAGQWLVEAVLESSDETIAENYTYFSHVVGALANWRSVRPCHFLGTRAADFASTR